MIVLIVRLIAIEFCFFNAVASSLKTLKQDIKNDVKTDINQGTRWCDL